MEETMDQSQLIAEKLKLDKELQEYIAKNGFDYSEYCAPSPGSWYENYRQRAKAIDEQLLPKIEGWVVPKKAA
jgi:hypothetical protein